MLIIKWKLYIQYSSYSPWIFKFFPTHMRQGSCCMSQKQTFKHLRNLFQGGQLEAVRSRTENQVGIMDATEVGSTIHWQKSHDSHKLVHRTFLPSPSIKRSLTPGSMSPNPTAPGAHAHSLSPDMHRGKSDLPPLLPKTRGQARSGLTL